MLQQQYMSEEEDMYNDETMDKVEEILLDQNPDRITPFTEKERIVASKTVRTKRIFFVLHLLRRITSIKRYL